jgi:hypothetical protein
MSTPHHLFRARPSARHRGEQAVFWLFRLATYFVLGCGAASFSTSS